MFLAFHRLLSLLPSKIYANIQALFFALNIGLGIPTSPPLATQTTSLASLPTNVFSFRPLPARAETRTIIVIHGLAVSAHDDPRICNLAKAIASSNPNHVVLVPYLAPLAECNLSDDPVDHIHRIMTAAMSDPLLCPSGHISIASACISAGFSLVAATNADVRAALCIGAHANVRTMLQHAIERKGLDDSRYGINGVLASFWHPRDHPVARMLSAYCSDDHLKPLGKPANALQPLLEEYPEDAKVFKRLYEDGAYLEKCLEETYDRNESAFIKMSPMHCIDRLKCEYVSLVHAKKDDIVPPSESLALQRALEEKGDVKVSCIITSLLNHGDQETPSIGHFSEVLKMISTFSVFFLPTTRPSPGKAKQI